MNCHAGDRLCCLPLVSDFLNCYRKSRSFTWLFIYSIYFYKFYTSMMRWASLLFGLYYNWVFSRINYISLLSLYISDWNIGLTLYNFIGGISPHLISHWGLHSLRVIVCLKVCLQVGCALRGYCLNIINIEYCIYYLLYLGERWYSVLRTELLRFWILWNFFSRGTEYLRSPTF